MTQSPVRADARRADQRKQLKIAAVAVGASLALVGGAFAVDAIFDPAPEKVAAEHCRDAVRVELRSPTTARFVETTAKQWGVDRQYHVAGVVEAENSFGAPVPAAFNCVVRHLADGRWQVRDVNVGA
jgi:hypothetical protein